MLLFGNFILCSCLVLCCQVSTLYFRKISWRLEMGGIVSSAYSKPMLYLLANKPTATSKASRTRNHLFLGGRGVFDGKLLKWVAASE